MSDFETKLVSVIFDALCDSEDMSEMGRAKTIAERVMPLIQEETMAAEDRGYGEAWKG
jgi:hypothetical protein